MPGRSLEQINSELVAKQLELDELTADSNFRNTVDDIDADLSNVTDFIDNTSAGLEEAGESIEKNFEQLSEAVDGMKELIGDEEFTKAVDQAIQGSGDAAENIQGGLESTKNVLDGVNDGLGKLQKALEAVQRIDDLRTTEGAEQLEALADAFEFVVEELGPFVDKVPGLGAFFRLYAAGIRNIAVSAKVIEDRVNEFNSIYRDSLSGRLDPGSSLYMTPNWFANQHAHRLQTEYDQLLDEAMEAAGAERDAQLEPDPGVDFSIRQVLGAALDHCVGLEPSDEARRKKLRAKTALEAATMHQSQCAGAVDGPKLLGRKAPERDQQNLEAADARLAAAAAAFERDRTDFDTAQGAYDDCVKAQIIRFAGYEGIDPSLIGIKFERWDTSGWEPAEPISSRTGFVVGGAMATAAFVGSNRPRLATAGAMIGGLLLAAGLTGLIPALSANAVAVAPVGGIASAAASPQQGSASSVAASSDSVALRPWMPAANPLSAAVEVEDQSAAARPDPMMPTVIDFCAGLRHGSGMSLIFYDLRLSYVPSGARIGLMSYGPPGGTTPFSGESTLDGNGYTRVQFDIFQFGSYTPQMLTIDNGGEITELPGSALGGTVEVGSAEQACDPADLAPLPPEPEPDDTVKTITAIPGGGAVTAPQIASTPSEGTVVTASSPQLVSTGGEATGSGDSDSDDDTERAIGLGLVAAATAGLATVINPDLTGGAKRTGRRRDQDSDKGGGTASTGPRTYTAEDRAFLQEIYEGASDAGVNIVGLSTVGSIEDSLAGSKANPVTIGKAATLYVRMAADGSLLPPRGASDTAAASILKIDVRPGVEFDSDGDAHVVWNSHVTQIDTRTARITDSSSAGPSNAEWEAKVDGRSDSELGSDPEFEDWVVESMPSTPGEAVAQALRGAGVSH